MRTVGLDHACAAPARVTCIRIPPRYVSLVACVSQQPSTRGRQRQHQQGLPTRQACSSLAVSPRLAPRPDAPTSTVRPSACCYAPGLFHAICTFHARHPIVSSRPTVAVLQRFMACSRFKCLRKHRTALARHASPRTAIAFGPHRNGRLPLRLRSSGTGWMRAFPSSQRQTREEAGARWSS